MIRSDRRYGPIGMQDSMEKPIDTPPGRQLDSRPCESREHARGAAQQSCALSDEVASTQLL